MTIVQGDTKVFEVLVNRADGTIFPLTGYTMIYTARNLLSKTVIALTSTAVISAPLTGVGEFTLLPSETDLPEGEYIYDVQIDDGGNNKYTVIEEEELFILFGVTQT